MAEEKLIKMYKKYPDTVHWLYGVNVQNKEVFYVPERLLGLFEQFGYKRFHICDKCGAEFKIKALLTSHLKKCQKTKEVNKDGDDNTTNSK